MQTLTLFFSGARFEPPTPTSDACLQKSRRTQRREPQSTSSLLSQRYHNLYPLQHESASHNTVLSSITPLISPQHYAYAQSWGPVPPLVRSRPSIASIDAMMDDFVSESESDYTSYWRDWVRIFVLALFLRRRLSVTSCDLCLLCKKGLRTKHQQMLCLPRQNCRSSLPKRRDSEAKLATFLQPHGTLFSKA